MKAGLRAKAVRRVGLVFFTKFGLVFIAQITIGIAGSPKMADFTPLITAAFTTAVRLKSASIPSARVKPMAPSLNLWITAKWEVGYSKGEQSGNTSEEIVE
eukprot:182211_1